MNAPDIIWHEERRRYRRHRRLQWALVVGVGAAIVYCLLVRLGCVVMFPEWFR